MKILVTTDVPLVGFRPGALVRGLAERGHEVTFVGPDWPVGTYPPKEIYEKVRLVSLSGGRTWGNLFERGKQFIELYFKLSKLLRTKRFDVLRPMMLLAGYLTIKCNERYDCPVLASHTDIYTDIYRQVNLPLPQIAVPLISHMERVIVRNSDLLIVDTPVMREVWKKWGLNEKKSVVLPHGGDYEMFKRGNSQRVREKYGLLNEKIIFFHGDITHLDGLDILIEAISFLVNTLKKPFKVMIVGHGLKSYINFLKQIIKEKNLDEYFIFTERKRHEEIPDYLACADICVDPCSVNLTTYSNVPNKIIEYIITNKPIIATNVSGLRAMFSDAIYYVPLESPQALSEAIFRMLNDDILREKFIERTRKISDYYRSERIIAQEEKLMQLLVNGKVDDFRQFDWQLTYQKNERENS